MPVRHPAGSVVLQDPLMFPVTVTDVPNTDPLPAFNALEALESTTMPHAALRVEPLPLMLRPVPVGLRA